MVLAYLRRGKFPKRKYNKLKMKKTGHCRILGKFLGNDHGLEMPTRMGISPIFNVADLYPYVAKDTETFT